jgi:hypothetical protein
MPLRSFSIGPIGEELYPRFVGEIAERFDDRTLDRNVVAREALTYLYLGRDVSWDDAIADRATPTAVKALLASFDPRNATLEAEYYREIDLEKWAPVKPLLWSGRCSITPRLVATSGSERRCGRCSRHASSGVAGGTSASFTKSSSPSVTT